MIWVVGYAAWLGAASACAPLPVAVAAGHSVLVADGPCSLVGATVTYRGAGVPVPPPGRSASRQAGDATLTVRHGPGGGVTVSVEVAGRKAPPDERRVPVACDATCPAPPRPTAAVGVDAVLRTRRPSPVPLAVFAGTVTAGVALVRRRRT